MGINFRNVTFKYAKKASKNTLNELNLEISENAEFIAILGHTGSGKSTLIQLCNALNIPTTGTVEINDQVVHSLPQQNKKLRLKKIREYAGLVFQFPEYQLFEETVIKDIAFGPKNFGKTEQEAIEKAKEVCDTLNISKNLYERSPFSLSGGQKRKIAIAGIIACDPKILMLDEPTVGLDPKGKDELMSLLVEIQKNTKKTIVMISHDMNIVAKYATRTIVLKDGNLVFDGKTRDLFEDEEKLKDFNLALPEASRIALELKKQSLIKFTHLPLTKEELKEVILRGDIYE